MKKKLDNIVFSEKKKDSIKETEQIWSLDIQDYLKYNTLKIDK